jgi:hypothetical protein
MLRFFSSRDSWATWKRIARLPTASTSRLLINMNQNLKSRRIGRVHVIDVDEILGGGGASPPKKNSYFDSHFDSHGDGLTATERTLVESNRSKTLGFVSSWMLVDSGQSNS